MSFNNTKELIEISLCNVRNDLVVISHSANRLIETLEAYYESLEDDDFPHKQNVYRFIQKYRSVFTERTLSLADEVESLRKDWQIKAGVFNKTKGVWEYE